MSRSVATAARRPSSIRMKKGPGQSQKQRELTMVSLELPFVLQNFEIGLEGKS